MFIPCIFDGFRYTLREPGEVPEGYFQGRIVGRRMYYGRSHYDFRRTSRPLVGSVD